MRKSKASIFIFAVLSLILVAAGAAICFMIPSMVPALAGKDLVAALGETFTVLGATFAFINPIFDITIVVALAIVAVLWIINLVLLIAKKKFGQLVPNLIWLLAGGLAVILFALSVIPVNGKGLIFEGIIGEQNFHDIFGMVMPAFIGGEIVAAILAIAIVVVLALGYILGLVAIVKSTSLLLRRRESAPLEDSYTYEELPEQEEEMEEEKMIEEKNQEKVEFDEYEDDATPTIIQNFYNGAPMPNNDGCQCHCHEHECECEEERPLTARELREIIREELDEREHPEENEPLSDERAREVIQEEIAAYYGKEETEEGDSDVMTADDLRKMIKEEVEGLVKPSDGTSLTKDEIREIIREELGAPKEEKESLSADEVRTIIAEELAKYLQNIAVVEEVEPQPEPEPEPEPQTEPEPEPQPEPEPEPQPEPEPEEAKEPVIRLSFAEKMTGATKEVKDNYNDLKAYAFGYGLKSRVANGGDTFRLHTKTYFRINMVGKGLKLYYALDPKDYENSPIPVQDVGHKNLYKDIPLCFKVRSGLSVKRAKQLIDDVCGKAGLTYGASVDTRDYAADLVNYVNDNSGDAEDDDE
ncbi:MAG: hypothetical protein K6G74_02920 [Bacilli bacterium]|nr:hypothetical protein [Bacilli bacterium]